jgi:beta-glucosidase
MKEHPPAIRWSRRGRAPALAVTAILLAWPPGATAPDAAGAERGAEAAFVERLLARMTLEEKLGQLTQRPGDLVDGEPEVARAGEAEIRAGRVGSFLGVSGAAATRRLQRIAVEESRLGIPLLFANDVIHGFRTIFPVPLGEAASFDPDAVRGAARIAATEAAAHGVHWTYAPMVDIARDPRWGRVVEGAGEDPFLGAAMAAAKVRGFQGDDLGEPNTVLATAKHFVAYGAAEGGRDYDVADLSERTLHEVYLPPFRAAVDAGVGAIMTAFNEIAGTPMHAHRGLVTDLLRGAWGFEGVVVSDFTGVRELLQHGVAADTADAARLALRAGVDVEMVSTTYRDHLPGLLRAGRIDRRAIDDAVRRVLAAKHRLGLFEDPYRYCDEARETAWTLTPEHRRAARELAIESLVLLRNAGGVLPIRRPAGTIAVIGPLADDPSVVLGSWAGAGRDEDAITPLAGIRAAAGPGTRVLHARGAGIEDPDTSGFAEAARAARGADAVVMFLGEHPSMSAEAGSRASLDLPGAQPALARAVVAAGKPTVVVLLNGRPLSIAWLDEHVPAILEAWYPGIEAGPAIAQVLFGDRDPGGRLPVTFPRSVGQVPIYYGHRNTGRPPHPDDKFTSKYLDLPWIPLYPFGWGLGYTTFEYRGLALDRAMMTRADSLTVRVRVANTGRRAGDEVVQLYVRDDVGSVTRPVKELRGFRRVRLEAGAETTVSFTLRARDLAFHDAAIRPVVEPGTFTVWVGPSSVEGLEARFEVVEQ